MSTSTGLRDEAAGAPEQAGSRMLVCAPAAGREGVSVSLADGVYDTPDDRVFWQEAPEREVLRLPRDMPVAVRELRTFPRQRTAGVAAGEAALLEAIRQSRPHGRPHAPHQERAPLPPDAALLHDALVAGDAELARAHAVVLWRQAGLAAVYDVMSRCLAQLASSWADGRGTVHAEHRATRAAQRVTYELGSRTAAPRRTGTVLLAAPDGEQHSLALDALAHLLRDNGWPVQVLDALPAAELVAAAPGAAALVLSLHTAAAAAAVPALTRQLRRAAPDTLLVLGGPAAPHGRAAGAGADLVTQSVEELLERLDATSSALTDREREVLTAVAAGHTTSAIACLLGVAASTVKSHLDHILAKTGTEHRAAAVAVALRRGWIT